MTDRETMEKDNLRTIGDFMIEFAKEVIKKQKEANNALAQKTVLR